MIKEIIFVTLACLILTSCTDNEINNAVTDKNPTDLSGKGVNFTTVSSNDILYSIFLFHSKSDLVVKDENIDHIIDGDIHYYHYGYFPNDLTSISVNSNQLNLAAQNSGSYYLFGQPLTLNGSFSQISIDGYGSVPDITDSIKNPINFAEITSPSVNSNITDNDNLTITWDEEANSMMSVLITVNSKNPDTNFVCADEIFTTDTGSYTLSSSYLQSFSKGLTDITLSRGYYKFGIDNNGKKYLLSSFTSHRVTINLTD